MPREIVIAAWCDVCFDDGGKKEPSTATYSVGIVAGETRPTPHVVLTCELHAKPIEDLLALLGKTEVLQAATIKGSSKEKATSDGFISPRTACPVCQVDLAKSGLIAHIYSQHAFIQRPVAPLRCPEPGCNMTFGASSRTTRHRIEVHGYDPVADALSHIKDKRAAR